MRALSPYVWHMRNMFEGIDNRRGFERRRFGNPSGIRIDRRSGQQRRRAERRQDVTDQTGNRQGGRSERRDLERRGGTDRRVERDRRAG